LTAFQKVLSYFFEFLNPATAVKNSEQPIDCFAAIRAARPCLPSQTAYLDLIVFFQWEFGNGRPILIHYRHLPIRKTVREHAVRPELFCNPLGAPCGRRPRSENQARVR
jgi:hypothetical protein